jgi:hypothetical protein
MLTDIFTRTSVLKKLEAGPCGPYLSDLVTGLQQQHCDSACARNYGALDIALR